MIVTVEFAQEIILACHKQIGESITRAAMFWSAASSMLHEDGLPHVVVFDAEQIVYCANNINLVGISDLIVAYITDGHSIEYVILDVNTHQVSTYRDTRLDGMIREKEGPLLQ